jgi:archaemetzincin
MFVRVVPIGRISGKFIAEICGEVEGLMNVRFKTLAGLETPAIAWNQMRRQHDAGRIISVLSRNSEAVFIGKDMPTLGIMEDDIYYNGLNFVFGIEEPQTSCLLVSIARLKPEFYKERPNGAVLKDRVVKEVIHEIGHHIGLDHCIHPFCVMSFSPSARDVDAKQKDFCKGCRIKLAIRGVNID